MLGVTPRHPLGPRTQLPAGLHGEQKARALGGELKAIQTSSASNRGQGLKSVADPPLLCSAQAVAPGRAGKGLSQTGGLSSLCTEPVSSRAASPVPHSKAIFPPARERKVSGGASQQPQMGPGWRDTRTHLALPPILGPAQPPGLVASVGLSGRRYRSQCFEGESVSIASCGNAGSVSARGSFTP